MAYDVQGLIKLINESFEAERDAVNAAKMKAYMKNQFDFFGIKSEKRKQIFKPFLHEVNHIKPVDNEFFIKELWRAPQRELQYCAMEFLLKYKSNWQKDSILLIEYMIISKSWWDTVDFIASNLAGAYFKKFPDQLHATFEKWNQSDNLWLNRSAIIFQLKYKNEVDTDLLSKAILRWSQSNEFFHQKAIGWALRQYAKYQPEWVINFVASNELKPLSKREALKHFKQ